MFSRSWHITILFLATLVGGCSYGRSHNRTGFLYWPFPFGDVVRTHDRPIGSAYNEDFDPSANRLEVAVQQPVAPVRSQQLIVVTVLDEKGKPLPKRKVNWMLEGVGNIIEVDESGIFAGRGGKVTNDSAYSYTSLHGYNMPRRNGRPNEDFEVKRGQTWCIVSSAVPGESHVTIQAVGIANWDQRIKVATIQWTGEEQPLATLPDNPVPPPAGLPAVPPPEGLPPLDPIPPAAGVPGTDLEHPRHVQPLPEVQLFESAPSSANVGDNVSVNVLLTNTGSRAAKGLNVQAYLDPNLEYISSDPPARPVEGNRLVWELSELPPNARRNFQLVCRSKQEGPSRCRVGLTADQGIRDEKEVTVQILPREVAKLEILQQGPTTLLMSKSDPTKSETLQVSVSNAGTGPASNVILKGTLVGLVETKTGKETIETQIGTLLPGQTLRVPMTVRPLRAGQALCRVRAEGDGGLTVQSEHRIDVRDSGLELKLSGPARSTLGKPVVWNLLLTNTGTSPLSNVMVSDILPPELEFVSASEQGTFRGREVLWRLGTLQPNETKPLELTTKAIRPTQNATPHHAFARGTLGTGSGPPAQPVGRSGQLPSLPDGGTVVETETQTTLMVQGYASLRMVVSDREDPVAVGKTTVYRVDVTNDGSIDDQRLQVVVYLPSEMRLTRVSAPVAYRVTGKEVTFSPLSAVGPGQTVTYYLEVQAVAKGDARFRAEMTSATLTEPVFKEESTNVP